MVAVYFLVLCALLDVTIAVDPLVTLNHGGQLRGKRFDYNGVDMDLFLGVPYAEPPTGAQRFSKPRPHPGWSGVRDALTNGNICPQLDFFTGKLLEESSEDCLIMDIVIPSGVDPTNKKPVMVWFHGGGYIFGSKDAYVGATLAKHGDVIILTVNYRLSVFGFLSEGEGTGNFGLWDQRAALLWVQKNIAKFGGDPDLVTIFGESAGGGSVAAQMIGMHSDGLFKRAIQKSGSLYNAWGWYTSERKRDEIVKHIKEQVKCPSSTSVYDCLREISVGKVFEILPPADPMENVWHPMPDNDFFPADVVNESYALSKRFDLLSGFSEQECSYSIVSTDEDSLENGTSRDYVREALIKYCPYITPLSVDLCAEFCINTYQLDAIDDDIDRGRRLSYLYGEIMFNADAIKQLTAHSTSTKSTYAYQFSAFVPTVIDFGFKTPSWVKESAGHGDELAFVFGSIYNKENNILAEYGLTDMSAESKLISYHMINSTTPKDKPLTDLIMTMWTNFAKSGNPNKPVALPSGAPEWPEYDTVSNKFMEFNTTNSRVITTPNKDRIDSLTKNLFSARRLQVLDDKAPIKCDADVAERSSGFRNTGTPEIITIAVLVFSVLMYKGQW